MTKDNRIGRKNYLIKGCLPVLLKVLDPLKSLEFDDIEDKRRDGTSLLSPIRWMGYLKARPKILGDELRSEGVVWVFGWYDKSV